MGKITATHATPIVNTCRPHASTRILEPPRIVCGCRQREKVSELLATAKLRKPRLIGSGNISDVEFYGKILH